MDRRQLLKLVGGLAAAGAVGSLAGCGSDEPEGTQMEQPSGRTVVIGLIAPAVGPYGAIGDEITKGFKLYLDSFDFLAGTHRVDLRIAEEGATPESAGVAVQRLLDQGVMAITGVANPLALATVAEVAEKARIPLIGAAASPATFAKSQTYTWRASFVQGEAGRALAAYARTQGQRAYVLHDDSIGGREDANAFQAAFTDLTGIIDGVAAGRGGYAAKLQAIRNTDVRTVFAAFSGSDALELLAAYRGSGLNVKLLGPAALTETVDLAKLGRLPDRVFTAGCYAPDLDNEDNQRFVSSYHKLYGVAPTSFGMAGYDSISVLDKMLRLVDGELNSVNLNRAASKLGRIESPRGTWSFNVSRTPQQKWYLRRLGLDGQVPANLLDNDLAVLS